MKFESSLYMFPFQNYMCSMSGRHCRAEEREMDPGTRKYSHLSMEYEHHSTDTNLLQW